MQLLDLPEEILTLILLNVFQPWHIKIQPIPSSIPGAPRAPLLCFLPRQPSLAPLRVCKTFHRISHHMPLQSFNGLIDIHINGPPLTLIPYLSSLRPLITRIWLVGFPMLAWCTFFGSLPALRYVEQFNTDTWINTQTPGELLANQVQPATRPYAVDFFKRLQISLREKGVENVEITKHLVYQYKPEVTFFGATEQRYDLAYQLLAGNEGRWELVKYRKHLTTRRAELCSGGVPEGMYR